MNTLINVLSSSGETIVSYVNLGLTVAFFAIIAILAMSFVWGLLTHGWKYGTYRLLFMGILVTIAFVTLSPIANLILEKLDLSGFLGSSISFNLTNLSGETFSVTAQVSTVEATLKDALTQVLKGFNVDMDPANLAEYAMALTKSLVYLVLIMVDAILLMTLGNIFVWLLWKILFAFIFCPGGKKARKKKSLRLLGAFESAIGCLLLVSMLVLPLTSVLNSLTSAISSDDGTSAKAKKETTNEVYSTVQQVVDTYEDSLFSKAFFSWSKNENGDTFDVSLMNYFTDVTIDDDHVISAVSELKSLVSAASYAIEGGLLTSEGVTKASAITFATSSYAPKLLSSLAGSNLVSIVMPYGVSLALNIKEVASYVKTETKLNYNAYNYGDTLNELADLYQTVIDSGILEGLFDEEGNLVATENKDSLADIVLNEWDKLRTIITSLDDKDLALFNDVMKAAIWVQIVHEYEQEGEASNEDAISIGVKDFFPSFELSELRNSEDEIKAVPDAIKGFSFSADLLPALDRVVDILKVDDELLPAALAITDHLDNITDDDINSLLKIVLKEGNIDKIEHYIDGYALPSSEGAEDEAVIPLLGLPMLQYAVPKFIDIGVNWINNFLKDANYASALDAADMKKRYEAIEDKPTAILKESQAVFGVLRPFAKSEAGKRMINDYFEKKQLTGVYFSPADGSFLAVDKDVLTPLAQGLKSLDNSRLVSYVLPTVMEDVINANADSINSALGLEGDDKITFDFTSEKTNVGAGLADLLSAYADCQDLILAVRSSATSLNGIHDVQVLIESLLSYTVEGSNGEKQLSRLLSAFVDNPLLDNPGHSNLINILSAFFKKANLGDFRTEIAEIFAEDGFDVSANIEGIVTLLEKINVPDVWKAVEAISGGTSSIMSAFAYLKNVSFEEIFSGINDLPLVSGLISLTLDSKLASYLSYGEGKTLTFSSVTDWSKEGKALDALISFAADIGDFSTVSLLNGDPDAIESTIKALADFEIFFDEDGNYVFAEFLASSLIDDTLVGGSLGKYFTNYSLTYDASGAVTAVTSADPSLVASYSDFRAAILSLKTPEDVDVEASYLAEVIRVASAMNLSALLESGLENADLSEIGTVALADLLDALASSQVFGRVTLTHLFDEVSSALSAALPAFGYANYYYLYDESLALSDKLRETEALSNIFFTALNPVFGLLDAEGKIPDDVSISIDDLSASYFLEPLLTAMADSEVWNSPSPVYLNPSAEYNCTVLEELLVYALKDASLFSADSLHTLEQVVRKAVYLTPDWDAEIDAITDVLNDFNELGLSISSGLDLDSLFDDGLDEGENAIAGLLEDLCASSILSKALPKLIADALDDISISGVDLTLANTYYMGTVTDYPTLAKGAYGDEEIAALASIMRDAHALGDSIDVSSLDDAKIESLTDLLRSMAESYIFNSLASNKSSTVFQSVMSTVYGSDGFKDYIWLDYSPKDAYYSSYYSDAKTKGTYLAASLIGVLDYPSVTPKDLKNLDTIDGDSASLKSVLTDLLRSGLIDKLKNGNVTVLDEADLESSLNSLDGCLWTMDMVPNVVAKTLKGGDISIDGVDFALANPFFQYAGADGYSNKMGEDEIHLLASIVKGSQSFASADVSSMKEEDIASLTDLLRNMAESYIFNSVPSGKSSTVFQSVMSTVYGSDGFKDYIWLSYSPKDVNYSGEYSDAKTKGAYLAKSVIGVLDYPSVTAKDLTNLETLNGTGSSSLKTVLTSLVNDGLIDKLKGGNVTGLSEEELESSLNSLDGCLWTMDMVPNVVAETLNDGDVAVTGVDFALANPFFQYAGADGYSNKMGEDEIHLLASIVKGSQSFATVDVSSMKESDVASLTALLRNMAESYIFNSVPSGKSSTVFQSAMSAVYDSDGFKDYIWLTYSPKDAYYSSYYSDAKTKGSYLAEYLIGVLDYPSITSKNLTNLSTIDGDSDSLKSVLTDLINEGLIEKLQGGNVTDLEEAKLEASLNSLDGCLWTMDMVPNVVAKTLKGGDISIDGVDLLRANPFFAYYQVGGSYDSRVGKDEIHVISRLISTLKGDGASSLSDPSKLTKDSVTSLRSLLGVLNDSKVFHLAGASYDLEDDKNANIYDETDLDVFRQVIYKFYSDSGLDDYAYDSVYDSEYLTAKDKLLASVRYTDDDKWDAELDSLLVSESGADQGFVYHAFDEGLFSGSSSGGVSFDSENFDFGKLKPSSIKTLATDLNGFSLGHDALAYSLQDLFDGDIGIISHTWLTHTFKGDVSYLESVLSALPYALKSLSFSDKASISYEVSTQKATATGNAFDFEAITAHSMPLGSDISLAFDGELEMTVTWTVSNFFLDEEAYANSVIDQIADALVSLYDDSTGKYLNVDSDQAIAKLFENPDTFLSFIRFFKRDDGLFDVAYGASYLPDAQAVFVGGDVILGNILSLELEISLSGVTVPTKLDLLTYLPHYDGNEAYKAYQDINAYFQKGDDEYLASTAWIRGNFSALAYFDMVYSSAQGATVGSVSLPRIHVLNNFLASSQSSINVSLADYLAYNGTSVDCLEGIYKLGLANKLYKEIRAYAVAGNYFYSYAANKPSSTLDAAKRSSSNFGTALEIDVYSSDALSFLSASKKLIEAANLLTLSTSAASNGWKVASADKATIETDLSSFAGWTSESALSDLVVSYYQGLIYELMVNRSYFYADTVISGITIPGVDWIDAPYGDNGYMKNAGSAVLTA